MDGETETSAAENSSSKMPEGSKKIQRSVSSMIKQMEMSEEEIQYRMENFDDADIGKQYIKYLKCTRCGLNFQSIINKGKSVGVHPLLGVLLCNTCCDYYGDGNFSLDSEGEDKYCRWCGEGGTIFACTKCICGFCEECIKKHFGKHTLEEVKNDEDWVCYFCNPRPLWYLRSICSLAKAASNSKREHLENSRNQTVKKKGDLDSNTSDTCSSTTDSIKLKHRRFSQRKIVKPDSSSSSDEEVKNQIVSKKKRRSFRKKSIARGVTEESSGSDARKPKKKAKIANEKEDESDLDKIKSPLLEKLKSIWKLTATATEVGLKSSRARLNDLTKDTENKTFESLLKEREELKACISVLVSTLSVAANSANSIGEDLKFDTAKDEREIFQRQETELKRFEKRLQDESTVEASNRSQSGKEVEGMKKHDEEEANAVKDEKKLTDDEGGANGSAPGSEKSDAESSRKNQSPAKPLLKVKSFARMLDENAYDRNKNLSVNGDCSISEKTPVVIDLYDIDTEESGSEKKESPTNAADSGKKISRRRLSQNSKISDGVKSDDDSPAKRKTRKKTLPEDSKHSADEDEGKGRTKKKKLQDNAKVSSDEDEARDEENKEKEPTPKKKRERKPLQKNKETDKSDSEKEVNEAEKESGIPEDEGETISETDTTKAVTAVEQSKEETEEVKKDEGKSDEKGKDSNETTSENSKKNAKSDSEESSSDSTNNKLRRITRNSRKDKCELKASFEEYKKKRNRFLKSSKKASQDEEKKSTNELDSSDNESEGKGKNGKQRKKRVLTSSDEESGNKNQGNEDNEKVESEKENQKSESDVKTMSSEETSSDEMSSKQMKKKKRERKKNSDSSSEKETKRRGRRRKGSTSDSSGDEKKKKPGRKNIKKILKKDSLKMETKEALKNEEERKKRVRERHKLFEQIFPQTNEIPLKHLILDFDPETKEPLVTVHKKLVKKLKPHQAKGVRFMWDNCFESVQRMEEDNGSGCILAHCMGLGKTLQVITLVHTVMSHDLGVNTVLIVCPLSTVSNWIREFEMWLGNIHTDPITLYDLVKYKKLEDRRFYLKDWHEGGGVLVLSYDMFRNMTKAGAKKKKSQGQRTFESALLDPGPDLVVCDEGHLLKNEDTALSKCMSRLKTSRRIVLTGTPLQNNLIEYHCMVQFVKPNILGTKKEFMNRFVNPINNGQFEDSTDLDVKIMKRRSHVLHSMLDGCIQRFDYSVLTPFLPEKHEYVLSISLTNTQDKVYRHFVANLSAKSYGSSKAASLFNDYHSLQRIWTHPRTMLMQSEKENMKEENESEGSLKDFVVSSDEESLSSKSDSCDSLPEEVVPRRRITRSNANNPEVIEAQEEEDAAARKNWWDEFYSESAYDNIRESNKLVILFDLLKHCSAVNDKVLVFSQSLYSLDLIEYFLSKVNANQSEDNEQVCGHKGRWVLGADYFRLDGSTNSEKRSNWCNYFNKESNTRARLFLLSTKAGGLGINLYGANRVVIFDASWNPSHDLQSIFRVYRFGQKKTCYVYRFLSEATMEEKIYERQVTKLSLAHRVVDEHQIERHYTMGNLQGLYTFEPTPKEMRKVPKLPKDAVLADLLATHKDLIVKYHEHDSLLENKQEEELSEEERKAAWKEYEEEKVQKTFNFDPIAQQEFLLRAQQARLAQGPGGLQEMPTVYYNPANAGQPFINPMFIQASPNIPLAVHQRGLKVGLTPAANESLESYYVRILNKESWMLTNMHHPNK